VRWLKKIVLVLVLLVVALLGLFLSIDNPTPVTPTLLNLTLPEWSLAKWLIVAFAAGGVVGVIINAIAVIALRTRLGAARRKLAAVNKELSQIRTAGLKDA